MALKKADVVVGRWYIARIGQSLVVVRIDRVHERSGWHATNLVTNRYVHIKSAAKLRQEATEDDLRRFSQDRQDRLNYQAEHKAQYGY